MKCKPVFTNKRLIYASRPRLPEQPSSSAVLPALVTIAKAQRREVEALCRLMTQHSAGAQMLHYLLRWWKKKPSIRMTEADWVNRLGLSKKEIRHGKKALESAGIMLEVIAHKTGRATFFSIDTPRFIKRLLGITKTGIAALLKLLGVRPHGSDGSVPMVPMGPSTEGQTVITESSTNLSHQNHDDEKIPNSDSGEFSFSQEGRDEQRDYHDASRKFLEEHGIKTDEALAAASKHPLEKVERAFSLARQHAKTNRPGYALAILQNGEFTQKPSWMTNSSPDSPSPTLWGKGLGDGGNAMKANFQKSSWSEHAEGAHG